MKLRILSAAMLTGVFLFTAALPATAASTPVWAPPADVSTPGISTNAPQLVLAPDGSLHAIWGGGGGAFTNTSTNNGATWAAPTQIPDTGGNVSDPQLAIAADGTATAVWSRLVGGAWITEASRRAPGGAWSTPVAFSAGQTSQYQQVAVASAGTATALWVSGGRVHASAFTGTWSAPQPLSLATPYGIQVATTGDGRIVAIWRRDLSPDVSMIETSITTDGGVTWSAPQGHTPPSGNTVEAPQLEPFDGGVLAAWTTGGATSRIVETSTLLDGESTWSTPVQVSAGDGFALIPHLGVAADGAMTVVWLGRHVYPDHTLLASTSLDGGATWSAPVSIVVGDVDSHDLSVAPDGTLTAVWRETSSGWFIRGSMSFDRGATWTTPANLSTSAPGAQPHSPRLAVAANGHPVAVWTFNNGPLSTYRVQSTYAQVTPTITSGTPPTPTIGSAYSFQLTALGAPAPTFAITSGSVPAGLSLSATGLLSGTPTAAGEFGFTVTASNGVARDAAAAYSLTVAPLPVAPVITFPTAPMPVAGAAYSFQFTGSGTPAPTFAVTAGSLPIGMTLTAGGLLSGTPAAGDYSFTISAVNGVASTTTTPDVTFNWRIAAADSGTGTGADSDSIDSAEDTAAADRLEVTGGELPAGLILTGITLLAFGAALLGVKRQRRARTIR